MNFFTRAVRYCLRQRMRTLILLILSTLLAVSAMTSLAIRKTAVQGTVEVKRTVGGTIHIDLDTSQENFGPGAENENGITYQYNGDYITEEVISAIDKVKGVVDTCAESESGYWGAAVDFEYFPSMFNLSYTDYGESSPYTVTRNSALNRKFLDGTYTLEEGQHISAEDFYTVMISKELAEKNDLTVGDEITLYSLDADAKDTFEIVGIFSGTEGTSKDTISLSDIPANQGYVDMNSYQDIFGETTLELGSVDVYVDSSENIRTILEEIRNLPELKGKTFTYETDTESFDLISNPLEALETLMNTAVLVITAAGAAVITLLLLLWTRRRKREAGILMAVGRSRLEIAGQLLTENIITAVPAFAMACVIAGMIFEQAGDLMLGRAMEAAGIAEAAAESVRSAGAGAVSGGLEAAVSLSDMAVVCAGGMVLICMAVLTASALLIRVKPGEILSGPE